MKKSKKKLKGMTLIEMIISIFIFAIMGGLLILVGTHIDATSKATNNLKNKVVVESPYAANHVKDIGGGNELPHEEMDITIKIKAKGEYWVPVTDKDDPSVVTYEKKTYGDEDGYVTQEMKADKYSTEQLVTDGMTEKQIEDMRKKVNGKLNLDFFEVKPEETPDDSDDELTE